MEFFVIILYLVCVAVFMLWIIAWVLIPFKLDRVNKNLEEIKKLLSEGLAAKKIKKTAE